MLLRTYLVHVCTRGTRRSFGVRIYHTIVRTTPRFPTHFSLSTDDKDRPRFKRYQRLFASSLANRTWPEKSRDFKGSRSSRSRDERFYLLFSSSRKKTSTRPISFVRSRTSLGNSRRGERIGRSKQTDSEQGDDLQFRGGPIIRDAAFTSESRDSRNRTSSVREIFTMHRYIHISMLIV